RALHHFPTRRSSDLKQYAETHERIFALNQEEKAQIFAPVCTPVAPLHSLSSSSWGLRLVEGPGLDHREQDVDPATSQTHHRSIVPLALRPFPVVIRLR